MRSEMIGELRSIVEQSTHCNHKWTERWWVWYEQLWYKLVTEPQMSCEMVGEWRSIVEQASHKARSEPNDDRCVTNISETSDSLATNEL